MKRISRRARPHNITLYNYVSSTAGVATYQRTQLKRVHLDRGYQQRLSLRGIQTEDTALLVLDLSDYEATGDRHFVEAEVWRSTAATQKSGSFTFQTQDFFVEGEALDELPGTTTKVALQQARRCFAVSGVYLPASGANAPQTLEVTAR